MASSWILFFSYEHDARSNKHQISYDSVRNEVLYNILIEYGIPMKLVRLIQICLTETYSRVRVDKNLSDMFPIRNGLKQGDVLSPLLFNFVLQYVIRRLRAYQDDLNLHISFWFMLMKLIYWQEAYILQRKTQTLLQSLLRRLFQK